MLDLNAFPERKEPLTALAFDYGTQRIGVAFGQSLTGTARPVAIIRARDGIPDWDELGKLIEQWTPDVLVIGLPYNLDGSDSELLQRATRFAGRLHGRYGKPCYGMDERLSSREAVAQALEEDPSFARSNIGGKKNAAIDDVAAQIILQNWFNELARQAG